MSQHILFAAGRVLAILLTAIGFPLWLVYRGLMFAVASVVAAFVWAWHTTFRTYLHAHLHAHPLKKGAR